MGEINLFNYQGTSGAVQRETSIAREEAERLSGETKARAGRFLALLHQEDEHGLTWTEIQKAYKSVYRVELHHGQISGLLTNLHKAGEVFISPKVKRGNCFAYIHKTYRHCFLDEERFDSPVQTKAGIRKAALEKMLSQVKGLHEDLDEESEVAAALKLALRLILSDFERSVSSD